MCDGEGEEGIDKSEGDPLPLTPPPEFKHDRLEYTSGEQGKEEVGGGGRGGGGGGGECHVVIECEAESCH